MPKPPSQLQVLPRRRSTGRYWLIGALALLGIAAGSAVILPKLMVGQATQAPTDAGTFVTRQTQEVSLQDRVQAALQQSSTSQSSAQQPAVNGETTPAQGAPQSQVQEGIPVPEGQPAQQTELTGDPASPPLQTDNMAPSQNTDQPPSSVTPSAVSQNPPTAQTQPQQPANNRDFQLRISEGEISSLIYSGLVQGTAPQYRESIQGVSTRISGGRASISVALQPRHLPDAFLRNLPGVNRDTPTVYLGGDLSLRREGNSVTPDIHQLRLGNFRVPMPFINAAVKSQVQQYVGQMLQMPDGRRAQLDDVQLEGGAVTLRGHLQ
ncbi:MAG: hypothetical protein ACO1RX_06475 [Candidatus Sericytochromatia bacterium]